MLLAKCSVYETYSSSFNLGMDNSIRFVSAACLVWKVACPFLLHVAYCFFSPLRTCFTHTPQSFSRSVYVLCWSSSLAGSFSVILTCSELGMGKTAQKCRKIRAFPSHLGVILSFLLTFLILPFPPPSPTNQSTEQQQPLTKLWSMMLCCPPRSGQSLMRFNLPADLLLKQIPILSSLCPLVQIWIKSISRPKFLQRRWKGHREN